MPEEYKYKSLSNESTIRLIRLERELVDNRIACIICHAERSDVDTKYDALSYVWGDASKTQEIRISDEAAAKWEVLTIHVNLWLVLKNFWQRKIFDRWIWTDGICLQQNNSDELGQQIPLMALIYNSAERVLAWLGQTISQGEALQLACESKQYLSQLPDAADFETVVAFLRNNFPPETEEAATNVRNATYWGRIWVVQEIVSATQIICLVGNLEVAFWTLVKVIGLPQEHLARTWGYLNWWKEAGGSRKAYAKAKGKRETMMETLDLWEMLMLVTGDDENYASARMHDRVYGILGLAETVDDGTSPASVIRTADYLESPAYVFIEAVLESYPDWDSGPLHYITALRLLFYGWRLPEAGMIDIFDIFQNHVQDNRTSRRHKYLVGLLLQTCDALFSTFNPDGSSTPTSVFDRESDGFSEYEGFHRILLHKLYRDYLEPTIDFKRTAQHNAVILGIALVLGASDEKQAMEIWTCWKARRGHLTIETRQKWRCCAHSPSQKPPTYDRDPDRSSDWERVEAAVNFVNTRLNSDLTRPCNGASGCDRTAVVFEIPKAGLRMGLGQGRFSLNLSSPVGS